MTVVRSARAADLEALCELERLCFGPEAWSRASVQGELDAGNRLVLAVEREDAVAGYATTMLAEPSADLLRIAVDPQHRRAGVGRALLDATLAGLPARGCGELLLEVDSGNEPALRLYEEYGFEQISVRRGYYRAGDALVLRLDLTPART